MVRGRAVLFDFWTLTCINWLRTAAYIRAWWRAYRDDGLVVIGVHTPEFSFEHEVALERAGGSIAFRFHARDAHLVLAGAGDPIPFRVLLDGDPPGAAAGEDVGADGHGVLREGRLYQLVRAHDGVRERTLEIAFAAAGAEAYAFTFG